MFAFNHYNYNVLDLEKSMKFYEAALGLKEVRRKEAPDGSWILVYLGDGKSDFTLELTWLRDRKEPYNLGETNSIWRSLPMVLMLPMQNIRKWDVSALKTPISVSISSMTPITTGSKSFPRNKQPNPR